MSDYIQKLIYDLMLFRRSPYTSTGIFSKLKHNADLCPRFKRQVDIIFGAFDKYRKIVYDIQGLADQGTDVIARQQINDENQFICFQIKSDDDLRRKDYFSKLKTQFVDTERAYRKLLDYYIVLCSDLNDWEAKRKRDKKNKGRNLQAPPPPNKNKIDQIREIEAYFSNVNSHVHIIEPDYALTFLSLTPIQIDAAIKNKLGAGDYVFRKATKMIRGLNPTESGLLFYMIWYMFYRKATSLTLEDLFNAPSLSDVYKAVPDKNETRFILFEDDANNSYVHERMLKDLQHLEDNFIECDSQGNYTIDLKEVDPIVLLMMDGNIRYGYEQDELLLYMMNLFGPVVGFEPQQEDISPKIV